MSSYRYVLVDQEDKSEGGKQDEGKGVEMAADFEGSLHDMQADPEADDQEQEDEGEERMDQVSHLGCLLLTADHA